MAALCRPGPSRLARPPRLPPITSPAVLLHRRPFSSSPPSASHIGAQPVPIPPDVHLFLSRSKDATELVVKGPLGELAVGLREYLKLGWKGSAAPVGDGKDGQAKATTQGRSMLLEDLCTQALVDAPTSPPTLLPLRLPGSKEEVLTVSLSPSATGKKEAAMWGLTRALLANAVEGVSKGFTATVKLVGVTYRAELENAPQPAALALRTKASSPAPSPSPEPSKPAQRLNLKLGFSHPVYVPIPTTPTFLGVEVPSPTQIILRSVDKREVGQLAANIRKFRKPEPYNGKGVFVNDETIKRKEVKKR